MAWPPWAQGLAAVQAAGQPVPGIPSAQRGRRTKSASTGRKWQRQPYADVDGHPQGRAPASTAHHGGGCAGRGFRVLPVQRGVRRELHGFAGGRYPVRAYSRSLPLRRHQAFPGAPVRAYQLSAHATGRAAFAIATAIPLCPGRPYPVCFSVWPRPTSARRACSPLPLAILYYLPRKRVNEAARGWGRTSMAAKGPASGGVLAMGLLHGHTGCPPRPGFPPPCPLRPAASSRDVRPAKLGRTAWPPGQSLGNASETHIRPRPHFPRGTRAKHRKLHLLPSRAASTAKRWAARPRVPQLRRLSGPWVIRTRGAGG